jgi:hypothetical protein
MKCSRTHLRTQIRLLSDEAPRWALLLCGAVLYLSARATSRLRRMRSSDSQTSTSSSEAP